MFFNVYTIDGSYNKNYISLIGIILGLYIYLILLIVMQHFIKTIYDLEIMKAFDTVFLFENEKNYSNIIGALHFESFEFEDMKKYLIDKTADLHRGRSKIVKYFG
jgi:hypothetical protein